MTVEPARNEARTPVDDPVAAAAPLPPHAAGTKRSSRPPGDASQREPLRPATR